MITIIFNYDCDQFKNDYNQESQSPKLKKGKLDKTPKKGDHNH